MAGGDSPVVLQAGDDSLDNARFIVGGYWRLLWITSMSALASQIGFPLSWTSSLAISSSRSLISPAALVSIRPLSSPTKLPSLLTPDSSLEGLTWQGSPGRGGLPGSSHGPVDLQLARGGNPAQNTTSPRRDVVEESWAEICRFCSLALHPVEGSWDPGGRWARHSRQFVSGYGLNSRQLTADQSPAGNHKHSAGWSDRVEGNLYCRLCLLVSTVI